MMMMMMTRDTAISVSLSFLILGLAAPESLDFSSHALVGHIDSLSDRNVRAAWEAAQKAAV